jgi:hypothetical protein
MLISPCVEIDTIKCNSLFTNWNLDQVWSDLAVEPIAVHAEIEGCIPQPNQAGQKRS